MFILHANLFALISFLIKPSPTQDNWLHVGITNLHPLGQSLIMFSDPVNLAYNLVESITCSDDISNIIIGNEFLFQLYQFFSILLTSHSAIVSIYKYALQVLNRKHLEGKQ